MKRYDAVVAGGSVAGLSFAAEASRLGLSVLVAEEHETVGEPEKCDGLVSLRGLRRFGFPPDPEVVQNRISRATVTSPSGRSLEVDASSLDVVVLRRSGYDRQLLRAASASGAEVRTGARAALAREDGDGVEVSVGGRKESGRYFVDATGPSAAHRRGILPAAKYEIEAEWVRQDTVEVYTDAARYPGFFAWVIPYGPGLAKVGAAGKGVDPFGALDAFLAGRPHTRLRRVAAPIYVGGPVGRFVKGRVVLVGESAGQVKPSTAGGIVTSLAGGVMAARSVAKALASGDAAALSGYQREWEGAFLGEMKAMLRLRGVFEKLSDADVDSVLRALSSPRLRAKLAGSDFDFHASAVLGALGVSGTLRLAKVVASAEARALLTAG